MNTSASQNSDVLEIPMSNGVTYYMDKKEWEYMKGLSKEKEEEHKWPFLDEQDSSELKNITDNLTSPSKKNDFLDNKPRWDLLPLDLIAKVVDVYTAGAKKYGDNTWQGLDNGYERYKAALFRHLVAYESGEIIDKETECEHLAQAAWNALAMLYFSHKNDK